MINVQIVLSTTTTTNFSAPKTSMPTLLSFLSFCRGGKKGTMKRYAGEEIKIMKGRTTEVENFPTKEWMSKVQNMSPKTIAIISSVRVVGKPHET